MNTDDQEVRNHKIESNYGVSLHRYPMINLAAYGAILTYSFGCRLLFGVPWYAMLVYFLLGYFAFYFWHWQAHHVVWWIPFNAACHKRHTFHHFTEYPPGKFFGTESTKEKWSLADSVDENGTRREPTLLQKFHRLVSYYVAFPGYTSVQHELFLFLEAAVVLVGSSLIRVPSTTVWCAAVGYVIMGSVANFLHSAFHVEAHPLTRYTWFCDLRKLHMLHHEGSGLQQFNILLFAADWLFGNFFQDEVSEAHLQATKQVLKRERSLLVRQAHLHRLPANTVVFCIKALVIVVCICAWWETQAWIANRENTSSSASAGLDCLANSTIHRTSNTASLDDTMHDLLKPCHSYMMQNPEAADLLLFLSSLSIDLLATAMMLYSVFGKTVRPFLGIMLFCILRQTCQSLVALPAPAEMIWRDPGYPVSSFLVTYETTNDFFPSGHAGFAVLVASEMKRLVPDQHRVAKVAVSLLGLCFVVFQCLTVLVLKSHWTVDVLCGAIVASYVSLAIKRLAPLVDSYLPDSSPAHDSSSSTRHDSSSSTRRYYVDKDTVKKQREEEHLD